MPPPCDPALLDHAIAVARLAGDTTLAWFRSPELVVEGKTDGTPVTAADRNAERVAREELRRRCPHDTVVGEEEDTTEGSSGRVWHLDPIDGTKAFTHGVPTYSTLVAVADEHGPAAGVIHLPALAETVWAGRGLGCFVDGTPCRVSSQATVDGSWIVTSGLGDWPPALIAELHQRGAHLRTWGDGYGYALVATGRVDAMVDRTAAVWDLAPMPVIAAEAGGRFSDLGGGAGAEGGHGLGSNGLLHEELLALIGSSG